jgi:RHS repeat-associated protein
LLHRARKLLVLVCAVALLSTMVALPPAGAAAVAGPVGSAGVAGAVVSSHRVAASAAPAGAAVSGRAAVTSVAAAVSPPTVTRVDSSVHVTPDSTGRVTIPYCPATDPCAFASPPAGVVVTGKAPTGGVGQLPINLIAYNRTTTGFTLRALDPSDPNGQTPITTAIDVWYHAASALTQNEEVRTVTVTTDTSGNATVGFASPHGTQVPTAVVASGVDPNGGGNIPVSLVVPTLTASGFTVRALNQTGAAINSVSITLSYYAAWAARIDPGTEWVAANATTTVTTDANGRANVSFPQALPEPPSGIVAVGVSPSGGGSIAAGLIVSSPTASGFQVRVANQNLAFVASQSVTFSYHAVAAVPNPVDRRSMTPGDSADVGTVTPTLHGVFTKRPATSGHVDFEVANPATGAVVASGAGATVASGADSAWAVPANKLTASSTYRWRARGNDGTGVGPWSAYKYFNTQAASLLGEQRRFGFEGRTLNDRSELKVNVANGDLLLHANDLRIRGTGLDFTLDRYYNSRQPGVSTLGRGWTMGVGQDVRLTFASSNHATSDVTYSAPTGFAARFNYDATESRWRHPPGVDADLTRNATTGEWTLKFQQSEGKLVFSDTTGRELRGVDRNNNTISFDYDASGLLSTVTDTQNRQTTLTYVGGRLDTVTDPSGRTVHYTYTADGNLENVTDTGGNVVHYRYNADLLVDQVVTGGGNSINRIDYADAVGKVADFITQYDGGFGVPTSAVTSFVYTSGQTKVTDPNGNFTTGDTTDGITTYQFDNRDRITKVIDALGHTQDKTYTSMDNVATVTDALQKQATLSWDPNDENLTSTSVSTGATSQLDYTSSAHPHAPTTVIDPQGNTLTFTYDGAGNLDTTQSSANPGVNLEDRDYNPNGTISKLTDGNANITTFGYDPKGNLTSVDNPAPLGDLTLTPDGLSRPHTMVDGKNQTTTTTYDPLDRPDVTTYQDTSTIDNNYDPDGNLTQVTDATGITTFAYDKMNRQIRKTLPDNTQLRYDYDHNGNLSGYTDGGGQVGYTYNQVNLLTELLEPSAATPVRFGYDSDNRRTTTTYPTSPTATVMTSGYDDAGRQTSIKATVGATTLSSFTYSYTKNGADTMLRQSMTDLSGTTAYTYDGRNRLTAATGPGLTRTYGYDDNSNRTNKTENGTTTSYGYNAPNQLTTVNGTNTYNYDPTVNGTNTYNYDPTGNLTGGGGWSLSYNATDQTTSITKPGGSALAPLTYAGGDQTQRTQAATTSYVNSALGVASATTTGSTDSYTRDNHGTLVSLRAASGSRFYYLLDGLGSVVGLVNSSGSKVNTYSYDPYGKPLSATEAVPNPWRYAAGQFDSQTGLTKFGTRYYDPDLGRFTQRDPSGQDLPYTYAGGDPINNIDPSGLLGVFDIVLGAVAGVATDLIATPFLTPLIGFLSIPIGGCVGGLAGTFVATGGSPDTSGDVYAGACIGGAVTNTALVLLPLLAL